MSHFEEVSIPEIPDNHLIYEKPCPNCAGELRQSLIPSFFILEKDYIPQKGSHWGWACQNWGWACQKCHKLYREVEGNEK